jgi:hypothetical protein
MARTNLLDLGSRRACALATAVLLTVLGAGVAATPSDATPAAWSQPAVLGTCLANSAPLVVFPSDSPTHATGSGAIVWGTARGCPGGEDVLVAALSGADVPGLPTTPRTASGRPLSLRGPLAASGGPYGSIALAGASPPASPSAPSAPVSKGPPGADPARSEFAEGATLGPFSPATDTAGPPTSVALTTAYLGDVALVSTTYARDGEGLQLRVQRHHAHAFSPPIAVSHTADRGRVEGLGLALDYRSDALVVWRQKSSIYARDMPASGRRRAFVQRLASDVAGPPAALAALLSDDNRGIVAWSEQSGGETSVYVDRSAVGVHFGAPQLLERFAGHDGLSLPEGSSPRLIRLSSESVMIAWTGAEEGHWVVRTAAIDLNGIGPVDTVSPSDSDALLAALAPGPDGDALALWTEPQLDPNGSLDLGRQAIFAARGIDARPARTIFEAPEQVAAPGPNSETTVAFDPDSDRAVAAWRGEGGEIDYSIRTPSTP